MSTPSIEEAKSKECVCGGPIAMVGGYWKHIGRGECLMATPKRDQPSPSLPEQASAPGYRDDPLGRYFARYDKEQASKASDFTAEEVAAIRQEIIDRRDGKSRLTLPEHASEALPVIKEPPYETPHKFFSVPTPAIAPEGEAADYNRGEFQEWLKHAHTSYYAHQWTDEDCAAEVGTLWQCWKASRSTDKPSPNPHEGERSQAKVIEALRDALILIYDKYENGDSVFEDVEEMSGPLGAAVKLHEDEENQILGALELAGIETALSFSKSIVAHSADAGGAEQSASEFQRGYAAGAASEAEWRDTAAKLSAQRDEAIELLKAYRISDKMHDKYCSTEVLYPGMDPQDDRCSICERTDALLSSIK